MIELFEIWLRVFTMNLGRYLIGVGLVIFLLLVIFRGFSARRKIQSRQASAADISRELGYSVLTAAVYGLVILSFIKLGGREWSLVYTDWGEYPLAYNILSLPLILLLHDSYFYWIHRLMHHRLLFKRFHLIHHRSRTPTPWAAYAFAPGEAALMAIFAPIATTFVPFHPVVVFTFLAIMILRNATGHSGIEFHPKTWVDGPLDCLTTVTHHDLHHQRARGNYGLYFTWWDRWMGTEFEDYKAKFRIAATSDGDECDQTKNTLPNTPNSPG